MTIKNQEIFEKALKTLDDNDRKTLEAFAHFLLVSSNSSLNRPTSKEIYTDLVDKANNALIAGYTELKVEKIRFGSLSDLHFFFEGRDKPLSFPKNWFNHSLNSTVSLNDNIKSLFVKFRPGTNRIDKVAFDAKFLTNLGKTHSVTRRRILVLNQNPAQVAVSAPSNAPVTSAAFVQKIVAASSDGWSNTPAIAKVSVPKSNPVFDKLDSFKEGRLRLSRVGEILFNFIDKMNNNKYAWDSEFFFGAAHDFTNIKTDKTYDVKCYFNTGDRLQLSQQTLNKCDADYIVGILVEEDNDSYTATVSGYISKDDFTKKTKPWAYNEYVELRSLELHELNSPEDLF